MPSLTQRMVDITKHPEQGQVIYRDSELTGFAMRVTPGAKSYLVESRVNGVKRRFTIGRCELMSLADARKRARDLLAQMAAGADPTAPKRAAQTASVTLAEVLDVYIATKELRPGTILVYRRMCNNAFREWLHMPIVQITKDAVLDKHRAMANGTRYGTSGKAYANGCFKMLNALLNFASEKYEIDGQSLLPVNPVTRLTKLRAWYRVHPRTGVIPEQHMARWYKAVCGLKNTTARDYFLFLLFTGLRRREGTDLKWDQVDFTAETVTVRRHQAKNHRDHVLPLSKFVLELLRRRYEQRLPSQYVFPGRWNIGHLTDFRYHILELRRQTGLKLMTHDLRRTFLSAGERLDLPYYVLKRLANHVVSSDTLVPYIVVSMERLKLHMERISQHFLELMTEEQSIEKQPSNSVCELSDAI